MIRVDMKVRASLYKVITFQIESLSLKLLLFHKIYK